MAELVPLCGILIDQSCRKVHLILTQRGIQTFTSSTLPLSFFVIKASLKILRFFSLHWLELFHQDLHLQLFSLKNAFF